MQYHFIQLGSAEATEGGGIVEALGLDIKVLIVQIVAFVIVYLILRKFVFPPLARVMDERQQKIDDSVAAAEQAKAAAEDASRVTERELSKAKKQAAEIVELARSEAARTINEAQQAAEAKAEHVINAAESRLEQQIQEARKSMRDEMVEIVVAATSTVLGQKVDSSADKALVERAIKEHLR